MVKGKCNWREKERVWKDGEERRVVLRSGLGLGFDVGNGAGLRAPQ